MDWKRKKELQEQYRAQGIPVGVGMPEIEPDNQEVENVMDQMNEDLTEQKMLQDMYGGDGGQYSGQYLENDKAKLIDYINTVIPQEKDDKGKVKSGEVPPEIMFNGGLYSIFTHNFTMSNFDENELKQIKSKFDTVVSTSIGAMKKGNFTPEMLAQIEGAGILGMSRINQNKDGQERYFTGVEASDTHHSYSTTARKSIKEQIKRALTKE